MSRESATAQHAEALGRNNVIVQIEGDGNKVLLGQPHLTLTRYLNRRRGGKGPSGEAAEILSPYALAIPFIGREPVMANLWAWMEKDQPISVRVLTARGGGGKTRLALELCAEATQKGWFSGFVTDREIQRFLDQQNLSTWGWNHPTLIVIDYAASRARLLHDWLVELANNAGDSGHSLRLLLLERHADPSMGWWLEAFGMGGGDADSVRRLLDPAGGPFTLPTFGASERRAIFEATLTLVGSGLDSPETPELAHRLAELSWGGEPLFLMMAGLTAARAGLAHVLALSPTDVIFEVARHEIHRIREIGRHRGIDCDFLAHMAAYVTLCQGLSRSQAEEVIVVEKRMLRYESVGDPPRIYEALYDALPGEGTSVTPVLPDLLGEGVTVLALGNRDSKKAEDAVLRAAALVGDRVVSATIRTVDDFGSDRKEILSWLVRLVQEKKGDTEAIARMAQEIPFETFALREIAVELEEIMVDRLRHGYPKFLLARGLTRLAKRQNDLGRRKEALEASSEAVATGRDLLSAFPEDVFRLELTVSLNNYMALSVESGSLGDALNAAVELLSLYRSLPESPPERLPLNASAILNLSILMKNVGFKEGALMMGKVAVTIYRVLASVSPEAFRPDLAKSLSMLAGLRDVGDRDEMLGVGWEAVRLYRDLASARPGAFSSYLGLSLFNLSFLLSVTKQNDKAVEASRESVELLIPYYLAFPSVFEDWMVGFIGQYFDLLEKAGLQYDLDLLTPLVEAGFFGPDPENPTSPDEATSYPEEEL